MNASKLTFVEFVGRYPGDSKCYFVGKNLQCILAETHGGKSFGGGKEFSSHRRITEKEARNLKLDFIDAGIDAVKRGICRSYMLRVSTKAPSTSCGGSTEGGIGRNWYPMNPAMFPGLR